MFENFDEIRKNEYIGDLDKLTAKYGIDGVYLEYKTNENSPDSEIFFICGLNIDKLLKGEKDFKDIFESKDQGLLAQYGAHLFQLDNCDPQKTYSAIVSFCKDAQLVKPVYKDKYINRLEKAVDKFGLTGTYVLYEKNEKSDFSGVYFVCGTDREKILNGDFDIRNIVISQNKNSDYFHYSIAAFPLDTFHSFSTHQFIMNFCRDSNFVQNIYKKYDRKIPETVTAKGLVTMKMLNSNLKNPSLTVAERKVYEKALSECFDIEDSFHDPRNPNYSKNQFLMSGQYDTNKGKMENWFRQNFGQENNCVTLEHLFTDCNGAIGHMTLRLSIADAVKEELKKRPDILYWMSKPMGEKIDFPEGQGYGPDAESNDVRTVDIAYNSAFETDIDNIVNKICCPEAYNTTPEKMKAQGLTPFLITIPQCEYENFVSLCNANNVPFCIDEKLRTHACGQYSMIVPKEKIKTVDGILSRLCIESQNFQIECGRPEARNPQLQQIDLSQLTAPKQSGLTSEQALQNLSSKFPEGDFQIIGGSFDDLYK